MNKAEAMALAVNDSYDLTFSYVPEYLKSKEHMLQLMKNAYTKGNEENEELFVPIIIGCVDNHNCRKTYLRIVKVY